VTLNGLGEDKEVLIHVVDEHPVTGNPQHIDFYAIDKTKLLHVNVPIEFTGEAPAEKAGHIVVKALHEVPIKVKFTELPQHFEVDLSNLAEIGDHIAVSAIQLPLSAELDGISLEDIVATVAEAKEEPIEEPAAPEEGAEGAEGAAPAEGEAAAPENAEEAS
jgi:large subunit ribosomal protein L25